MSSGMAERYQPAIHSHAVRCVVISGTPCDRKLYYLLTDAFFAILCILQLFAFLTIFLLHYTQSRKQASLLLEKELSFERDRGKKKKREEIE
jgi:hypothetical protein